MPGNLISHFTSQAEWEAGTRINVDTTTQPGAIIPSGDYSKQWNSQADWNTGTHSGTVANADGTLSLAKEDVAYDLIKKSPTQEFEQYLPYGGECQLVQRISARGTLRSFYFGGVWSPQGNNTYMLKILALDGTALISFGSWAGLPTYPTQLGIAYNFELTQDVLLCLHTKSTGYPGAKCYIAENYPPGVTDPIKGRNYAGGAWQPWTSGPGPAWVKYTVSENKLGPQTWTSASVTHGIAEVVSTWEKWAGILPDACSVTAEARYSADGITWGDWQPFDNGGPLPGEVLARVQVRLTLETTHRNYSPSIDWGWFVLGPLHRWFPANLDVAARGNLLMLVAAQTGLGLTMRYGTAAGGVFTEAGETPGIFDKSTVGDGSQVAVAVDLIKTDPAAQSLADLWLYEAVVLNMIEDPVLRVRPPEVTDVICYVEDSSPLVEVTASLGVPDDEKVEVRISVPAGSSEAYAQAYADAYLADHGSEKRSLTCKVPVCTRLTFGGLVPIAVPSWGYTQENPWLAMVQSIAQRPLGTPPHTELAFGDFEPDDTEALIRLLGKE